MLVGSQLKFTETASSSNMDSKDLDRVFTIVSNEGAVLKISPQTFTAVAINSNTDMHSSLQNSST